MFLPDERNPYLDMPATPTTGTPAGIGEAAGAGVAGSAALRATFGDSVMFGSAYDSYIKSAKDSGYVDSDSGFYFPIVDDFTNTTLTYPDIFNRELSGYSGTMSEAEKDIHARLERIAKWGQENNKPQFSKTAGDLVNEARESAGFLEKDIEDIADRSGVLASGAMLGGSMLGTLGSGDPLNLATLPFGGFGKTIATRLATEAAVQSTIEAVNVFTRVDQSRRNLGLDELTLGQKLADVAMAGAGGALVRGGIEVGAPAVTGAYRRLEEKLNPQLAINRKIQDFVLDKTGGELPFQPSNMTQVDYARQLVKLNSNKAEFRAADSLWELSDAEKDVFRVPHLSDEVQKFEIDIEGLTSSTAVGNMYTGRISVGDGETISLDAIIPSVSQAFEPEARMRDPDLFAQLDEQAARVSFLEKELDKIDDRIGRISVVDGVELIDPVTGQLLKSINDELDGVIPKARRIELEHKRDQIVANLSEEEIARAHQLAVDKAKNDNNFGELKKPRKEIEKQLNDEKRRLEKTSVKAMKVIDRTINERAAIGRAAPVDPLGPLRVPPVDVRALGESMWNKVISKPSERITPVIKEKKQTTLEKIIGDEAKLVETANKDIAQIEGDKTVTIGGMDIPKDFEMPVRTVDDISGTVTETKTVQQIIDELKADDEMLNIMKVCEL